MIYDPLKKRGLAAHSSWGVCIVFYLITCYKLVKLMVYNPPKQSSSSNSLAEVQKSQAPAELEEEVGEVLLQPEMGS